MTRVEDRMPLRIDEELQPDSPPSAGPLDTSQIVGTWRNTDRGGSGGTLRLVVTERDGELVVRGFGVGDPEPYDWGETPATPMAQTVAGQSAWAFNCSFDLGFIKTDIAAYGKEGILIAASFNRFEDGSGRADYWTREFFHLEGR
jgi:hypothetical protein